jgi:PAS domain S-box-containing protein
MRWWIDAIRISYRTALCLAVLVAHAGIVCAAEGRKMQQVLVLHSYHQGNPFTDSEAQGISSVLGAASNRVEQHVVYMDTKRVPAAEALPLLKRLIRATVPPAELEGVLAVDNEALEFVVSNRNEFFQNVPVVFCGIKGFQDSMVAGQTRLTGVTANFDYEETVEAALKLRPQMRHVIALTDHTSAGVAHEQAVRRLASHFEGRCNLTPISLGDRSMDELLELLRRLGPDSAILLLNHYQDATGRVFSEAESLEMILEASPVPLFILTDTRLRAGVVGGRLTSGVAQGRLAAEMLLPMMRRDPPPTPPVVRNSPNRWFFDYQGLRRWEIAESALPGGSVVVNRPETLWLRYRRAVLATLAVTATLAAIIVVLVVARARRRRVEMALRESNQRLAAIFEGARDAIIITDTDTGLIQDMNSQAERLLETPKAELIGQPHTRLYPTDTSERSQALFAAHLGGQSSSPVETIVLTGTQRRVPVEINSSILELAPGRKVMQGIYRDITERKQFAERLRQAQRMEAVGHLAGGVAHDFNNLLTVIRGHLDLLAEDGDVTPSIRESLGEMRLAAKRASDLTQQLLTFSHRQVMRMTPLNLVKVVDDLLRMLQRLIGEQVTITKHHASDQLWIEADLGMAEQVITNLALNARDAMPQGGKLMIDSAQVEVDPAYAQSNPEARPGTFACLTIADTGSGMDTSMIKRIFEPFFSTKDLGKGSGLGLATVYGIVKQHKGWIEVQSRLNQGSVFKVYLKVTDKRPPKRTAPSNGGAGTTTGPFPPRAILLVEDEPSVRAIMAQSLRDRGHEVMEASHAAEANALWQQHKNKVQLLLTDMIMPGGATGYELACRLREEKSGLPVIIASGYSADPDLGRRMSESSMHYLAKPFDMKTLEVVIAQCFQTSNEARPDGLFGNTAKPTTPE